VCLAVPQSGGDSEAVVDRVAAATALAEHSRAVESGHDLFDVGCGPPTGSALLITDDAAVVVAAAWR
jgi:hypothetical protein